MEYYDTYKMINSETAKVVKEPLYPKFQGMFWIFAEALLVAVLALRCIEKGGKASRILAMIGLGFGAVSVLLQLLLVWGAFSYVETTGFFSYSLTAMGKFTSFTTVTMIAAIAGALVLRIKVNEKVVNLLRNVAVFSGIGIWLITTIMIFSGDLGELSKILNLEGVFSACFMTGWITALVMSKISRNDQAAKKASLEEIKKEADTKTAAEKEVQVRLEAEKAKAERDAMPPLQDESMAPTVNRDNELKVDAPNDLNNG